MSHYHIRLFPDSILRKKAQIVTRFDENLRKITQEMTLLMKKQPHGIGIAAPQVGISLKIAIVDVSPRVPEAQLLTLVNPKIQKVWDEKLSREGCMSVPDYLGNIKRYDSLSLHWQDLWGQTHIRDFRGIEAICIQHEVDHLSGILFLDRVASLKRDMIPRAKPKH